MKTLYYKVQVRQHLPNYDRVAIYTVADHPSGADEKDRNSAMHDAICMMQRDYTHNETDTWSAEILEIAEA
jgi:hypothetical protein